MKFGRDKVNETVQMLLTNHIQSDHRFGISDPPEILLKGLYIEMPIDGIKINDAINIEHFLTHRNKEVSVSKTPPDIFFSLGNNPLTDGSAYLEFGDIKVLCHVTGPTEIRHDGQLVVSFKLAPFVCWFSKEQQNYIEKRFSHLILSAIEPSVMLNHFPRGKYEISVLVLDFSGRIQPSTLGNFLAAAVTCTGLGLLNTGVQMYDLPVALNLNLPESDVLGDGYLCVAVLPRLKQFSMLHSDSSHIPSPNIFKQLLEKSLEKCTTFSDTIRSLLYSQYYQKDNS